MYYFKDLYSYYKEYKKYKNLTNGLFWFKKYSGIKWIKGQNFGDYFSPIIVSKVAQKFGFKKLVLPENKNLFAIGSILHFAKDKDIIWGSGINGKIPHDYYKFKNLDIRMVRGPKTKNYLESKGHLVPNSYGEPGLLLSLLNPDLTYKPEYGKIVVLPNLNEINVVKKTVKNPLKFVSPLSHWSKVVFEILTSELVLTSSLHGIVVADSFGIPVRFVMPVGGETIFKYQDYFYSTGRNIIHAPSSFKDGINIKTGIMLPKPIINTDVMLETFPKDLFV